MRRIVYMLAALALSAVAIAPLAGADPVQPLPPQAAEQAINAPGRVVADSVHRVSPAEAANAGRQPGWVTEGTPPKARGVQSARRLAAYTICWSGWFGVAWGTWPYDRYVYHDAYWCGNGWTLSYRTQHVLLDSSFCNHHDAYGYKEWGGVGDYDVGVMSGGNFDCNSAIPWITYYHNQWFRTYLAADGGAFIYDYN